MDTKLKGDIAEQAAILHALKRGWGVLKPVGDRLPYDLVLDVAGSLLCIQVKYAWNLISTWSFCKETCDRPKETVVSASMECKVSYS